MTPNAVRLAIVAAISSSWATATPICYPNQQFIAPQTCWISFTIKMSETILGELGNDGISMRVGILMVSIYDLVGNGVKNALDYADRVEAIFRRKELSGVIFNEPSTDTVGVDESGYFHVMVSIDFRAWVGE